MKIGFVSDAHGNSLGLELCVQHLRAYTENIYFLGDAVGYLPDASGVIKILKTQCAESLIGNHDAMLLGVRRIDPERDACYRIEQISKTLSETDFRWLSARLPYLQIHFDNKRILCVHGSPWDPMNGYVYEDSQLEHFGSLRVDVVVMGHTHRPFVKKIKGVTVVNVGSCGLPRDVGNLASCAVYNTDTACCEIFRIPFDAEQIIDRFRDHLHPTVVDCLRKKASKPIVGITVPVEHV